MNWASYVAKRLASLVGVVLMLTVAVFVIQRALPSDPVRVFLGRNATPAQVLAKKHELGYDRSLPRQYVDFVVRLLHGDLGVSLHTRAPVRQDIVTFFPATLELAASAAVLAVVVGTLIGLVSARDGRAATGVRVVSVAVASAPTFLVGILGILLLYRQLGWFPAGQRSSELAASSPTGLLLVDDLLHADVGGLGDALRHLVMPATVLALGPAVAIGRTLRGSLRDVLGAEHVRSARAKGLSESAVTLHHGLRNAANPVLAMAGLQVGFMLAGSVLVEVVFSWPGLGLYLSQSIQKSDFPAVIGVVLVLGIAYVVVNAVVDVLQLAVEPRLRGAR